MPALLPCLIWYNYANLQNLHQQTGLGAFWCKSLWSNFVVSAFEDAICTVTVQDMGFYCYCYFVSIRHYLLKQELLYFLITFRPPIKIDVETTIPNEFKIISFMSNALSKIGCRTSITTTVANPLMTHFFHVGSFCDNGYRIPKGRNIKKFPIVSPLILLKKSGTKSNSPPNQFIVLLELQG